MVLEYRPRTEAMWYIFERERMGADSVIPPERHWECL
jgi:hypothetical protein